MRPPVQDQITCFERPPVAVAFDPKEDKARPEFYPETKTENVLRRLGVSGFSKPAQYGVQDFDVDLQMIRQSVRRAVEGVKRLPEEVQARYATEAALLEGLARGELFLTPEGLVVPEADVPPSGASASGTGQAEGAAGGA